MYGLVLGSGVGRPKDAELIVRELFYIKNE